MKSRPWPVIIVCLLFFISGSVGFVYHFKELLAEGSIYETIWVQVVRILAIVCAVLLWKGVNWARWVAIVWLLYHIIISTNHSTTEVVTHIVILVLVTLLLYLPKSSAFFKAK